MKSKKTGKYLGLRVALFLLIALGVVLPSFASDVSVEMSADRTTLGQDDELQVEVVVREAKNDNQPAIAGLENFDSQGVSTSSQVQIINGSTSHQKVYTYTLVPKSAGMFRLGPARVVSDGKTYQSEAISIQVMKGAAKEAGRTKNFELTADVDNKNPFVSEQITYTFRFFKRARDRGASASFPDFKAFWREELEKQTEYEKVIDGTRWDVAEIKFALFPLSPGPLTIEPTHLEGQYIVDSGRRHFPPGGFFDDSFFGMGGDLKHFKLATAPIVLNVRPLPATGRPADFSGLVGKFRVVASLSKSTLAVGDSTTLSVVVEGRGNIRDARMPAVDFKGFKTYDDQPTLTTAVTNSKWGGTKTFKKALVPLEAGSLVVPPIRLVYFDPAEAKYKVSETTAFPLTATPGSEKETLAHVSGGPAASNQKEVRVQGEDLMPVKRELTSYGTELAEPERNWLVSIILLLPLFYAAGFGVQRYRERLLRLDGEGLLRRAKAYRHFQTGLKGLTPSDPICEKASYLLRGYLGEKLGFDGHALTSADTRRKLGPHGISDGTINGVEDFLKLCERAQYGGETLSSEREAELKGRLAVLGKTLEKEISA